MSNRTLAHRTIRDARRDLAAAFPAVAFTYGTSGRGRDRGHCIGWHGGPMPGEIARVAHAPRGATWHYDRTPTAEELAAYAAQSLAEWDAWTAGAPARDALAASQKAANALAGRAKAADTRHRRTLLRLALVDAWPSVSFDVTRAAHGGFHVSYAAPILRADVARVAELSPYAVTNRLAYELTPEYLASPAALAVAARDVSREGRAARRLAASRARAARQATGRARVARLARQLSFAFMGA